MPTIDFYIIKQPTESDRLHFCCRLIEKIYSQGRTLYLHMDSREAASELDDLLWKFRPESFIPHALKNTEPGNTPILIGYDDTCSGHSDVLINLSNSVPQFHAGFQRILEIVSSNEHSKQLGRQHWAEYKKSGYEISKFDI